MKNVHVLPTDKPSSIWINYVVKRLIYGQFTSNDTKINCQNQNIYITNSEKSKEGDWCIVTPFGADKFAKVVRFKKENGTLYNLECKKIILTTDQYLIKDGVQAIDDEFLEWFVKNPNCEKVGVVLEKHSEDEWIDDDFGGETYTFEYENYKIIIPKEEPKQDRTCTHNCSVVCGECQIFELKQETLSNLSNPVIVVRNDDKEEFIHLSNGMYRTKWGILNNSISTTPLEAFDKSKFTFYYE